MARVLSTQRVTLPRFQIGDTVRLTQDRLSHGTAASPARLLIPAGQVGDITEIDMSPESWGIRAEYYLSSHPGIWVYETHLEKIEGAEGPSLTRPET